MQMTASPALWKAALRTAVTHAAQYAACGVTPEMVQRLRTTKRDAIAADPKLLAGAYAAIGMVARAGDASRALQAEAGEQLRAMTAANPAALHTLPALCRSPAYWLGAAGRTEANPPRPSGSFADILVDARFRPIWVAIETLWQEYIERDLPIVRAAVERACAWVASSPLDSEAAWMEAQQVITVELTKVRCKMGGEQSSRILEVLDMHDAVLSPEQRREIKQLSNFLGHDLAHMIDHLSIMSRRSTRLMGGWDNPQLRCMADTLRTVFQSAHVDSILQVLNFPLGMIPQLFALAECRPIPMAAVNPYQVAVVSSGLAFLRQLGRGFAGRFYQQPGLQAPLLMQAGPQLTAGEGIRVHGAVERTITTHPVLFASVLYNTCKNALFALAEANDAQDPYPQHAEMHHPLVKEWYARQRDRVSAPIRCEVHIAGNWQGIAHPGLTWITVRDSAGGFPLPRLIDRGMALVRQQVATLTGVAVEDVAMQLRSMTLHDFDLLTDLAQAALGLRDRSLVQRLLRSTTNPAQLGGLLLTDLMELASIYGLSGHDATPIVHADGQSSGFGLFGIGALTATGGMTHQSYFLPSLAGIGTQTVMTASDLHGYRYASDAIRSIIETSV